MINKILNEVSTGLIGFLVVLAVIMFVVIVLMSMKLLMDYLAVSMILLLAVPTVFVCYSIGKVIVKKMEE